MKFYYLCVLLFPLFFSCSEDTNVPVPLASAYQKEGVVIDTIPINKANPYDDAGQIHHQLLTAYFMSDSLPTTLTGIIEKAELIANDEPSFIALTNGVAYDFTYADKVAYIISKPAGFEDDIINNALETTAAKNSLKSFMNSLLTQCELEDDYGVLHNYIVAYENGIMNQSNLTTKDKQVILTTSSIARHSVYARKKKPKKDKDPEWQYMVGNITAAIDGADDSMEDAIMKALITGIVENK